MPRASVATIIFDGSKVLLVKNLAGSSHIKEIYGLPSGKVEPGETETHAAAREFNEETGLQALETDLTEFPDNYYIARIAQKDGSNDEWSWRVYLCQSYTGQLHATQETEPEWVEIAALKNYHLLPNIINAVNAALSYLKNH
jgi:8-oxo-dGTP diphosphatase